MATDFFQRQDNARRMTKWLVVMFILAVVGIVGGVFLATIALLQVTNQGRNFTATLNGREAMPIDQWKIPLGAGGCALALIGGGSLYKVSQLAGGGTVVAEGLGGHRIPHNTTDPVRRRLVNVVEEMALASGVPVPPIYLLESEQAINAFAAGYTPSDAVVAVTRGTAEQLTRDELQGVVAHEFSHILNGDMRLNVRLIGVLHGILLLGLIGRMLFQIAAHSGGSRRSSKQGGGVLYFLGIGLALIALGFFGTLFGNLIKAAVSRQREYLADASAVQFTRNPGGIAGALKKIGGLVRGSRLQHPKAAELSHMYFGQGVWEGFTGLMATHPPLEKRILRVDPQWDGKFPEVPPLPAGMQELGVAAGFVGATGGADEVPVEIVRHSSEQVGLPTEMHRSYVAQLIDSLPAEVIDAVHEPYGARAVMFALLLDRNESVREKQFAALEKRIRPDVVKLTHKLATAVSGMDSRARLPLVDMALPALRTMTKEQYQEFSQAFQELVSADDRISIFEWMLHSVLMRHLRPQFERVRPPRTAYYGLARLGKELGVLYSTLAYLDTSGRSVERSFRTAADLIPEAKIPLLPKDECTLAALQQALGVLVTVSNNQRQRIISAAAELICYDRDVAVKEAELLRGICDMLDCPMPPLLPGQPLA